MLEDCAENICPMLLVEPVDELPLRAFKLTEEAWSRDSNVEEVVLVSGDIWRSLGSQCQGLAKEQSLHSAKAESCG